LLPNCYQNMQVGLGAESWGISPFHCYAVHATQGSAGRPSAHLSEHHLPAALAHVQATPRPAFRTQRILLR
jgi:hypothetical protein